MHIDICIHKKVNPVLGFWTHNLTYLVWNLSICVRTLSLFTGFKWSARRSHFYTFAPFALTSRLQLFFKQHRCIFLFIDFIFRTLVL